MTGNIMESTNDNELFGIEEDNDNLVEMVNDVEEDFVGQPKQFTQLLDDAEKPLYNGCKKFTKMSALVRLYKLKASKVGAKKASQSYLD